MIKGIQRQSVLVRTPESPYFEEAQFVLRADYAAQGRDGDMLAAANRILEECGLSGRKRKGRKKKTMRIPSFLFGSVCGGSAVGLLWLILSFL